MRKQRCMHTYVGALALLASSAAAQAEIHIPDFLVQPYFDVQFVEKLPEVAVTRGSRGVRMRYLNEAYTCHLPINATLTPSPTVPVADEEILESAREVISALSGRCHLWRDEYWAYKICHHTDILQFEPRFDDSGKIYIADKGLQKYILGRSDSPNATASQAQSTLVRGRNMMQTHMDTGDICDITGEPREINMLYFCDPQATGVPQVRSFVEMYICSYEMQVGIASLCDVPKFLPQEPESNAIYCVPESGRLVIPGREYVLAEGPGPSHTQTTESQTEATDGVEDIGRTTELNESEGTSEGILEPGGSWKDDEDILSFGDQSDTEDIGHDNEHTDFKDQYFEDAAHDSEELDGEYVDDEPLDNYGGELNSEPDSGPEGAGEEFTEEYSQEIPEDFPEESTDEFAEEFVEEYIDPTEEFREEFKEASYLHASNTDDPSSTLSEENNIHDEL